MTNPRLQLKGRFGSEAGRREMTMISILSGKGGVGKSIIAFNLAERLASRGHRTLLVDADVTSGNLHLLANVAGGDNVRRLIAGEPLRVLATELVTESNTSFDLLSSSAGNPPEEFEDIRAAAGLARRLRTEAAHYEFVIVDHASGVSKAATILASVSDLNLVVLIPELTSISDAYGLCKYLYRTYEEITCGLLINRTQSEEEVTYVRTKFAAVAQRFLGRSPEFLGKVDEDAAVRLSVARQQPIARVAPESVVSQALNGLARSIVKYRPGQSPDEFREAININPAAADIRE